MKRGYILLVLVLACTLSAYGQDSTKFKAGWGNLDYSVPESPAFKLLGTDPSSILQPTSARAIGFSVGNYFFTNGPVIPKSLAVEISPLQLNGNCSLNDYNKNPFWYRMTISVGTTTASNGSYATAEGIRFTIIDKSDLRTNTSFLQTIDATLGAAVNAEDKAIPLYIKQHNLKISNIAFRDSLTKDSVLYKDLLAFETQFIPNNVVQPDSLAALRNKYRANLWNAEILQVGFAALQNSKDSLIKNLSVSKLGGWVSYGCPVGKMGQLLLGGQYTLSDSSGWKSNYSVGARLYYGKNETKVYAQLQYGNKNMQNAGTASVGCEFNISNGLWGQVVLNFVDTAGKISYQPGFNIGLGTGEKKHN